MLIQKKQLESILPAGNSSEQHPSGGRNCFTMTMQSLCRVLFRMAIIPTPIRTEVVVSLGDKGKTSQLGGELKLKKIKIN